MPVVVTITSEKKQKGHFLKNRELTLYINGKRHNDYLSHEIRVSCLKKAIVVFDTELQTAADTFRSHPFGAYLWLYTPDFIRGEEISGFFRLTYLKEIIKYIANNWRIEVLKSNVPLSVNENSFIKALDINLRYNYGWVFINRIINLTQNTKEIFKAFSFNLKQLFSKTNPVYDGNLIDTSARFYKNRYDDLEKVTHIFNGKVKYFSGDQIEVKGCKKSEMVVFKRELNVRLFFSSLKKSFQISRFIRKNKNKIPAGLYYNYKGFFKTLLYWDLILAEKSIEKFLKKSKIKTIVQVSTITKPIYRALIASAKLNSIQFIQVASRSLTELRNSERLLKCDVEGCNNIVLPDWYIFKDNFSKRIFQKFPFLEKKILVGARFKMEELEIRDDGNKPTALFLLFSHRKDVSYRILSAVSKAGILKNADIIIYRCHPSYVFDIKTIEGAFQGKKIINITGQDYTILLDYRVIAVAGPTSAALEAVSYGSLLLWSTFVYDDAVMMDDVMNKIGIKCNDQNELEQMIKRYQKDRSGFYESLQRDKNILSKNFVTENLISEQISYIINLQ